LYKCNLIRKQTRKLYTTQPEHRSHKVANIRCFILIKCSEQKARFKKYLTYLEAAFLIKTVHRVDVNAKTFKRATRFKVYLTNPSMRAALLKGRLILAHRQCRKYWANLGVRLYQ
jgi:predicted AAA+ superfamily ATPase